jgi:hypothetical protein
LDSAVPGLVFWLSETYQGHWPGYVFKRGDHGNGYYADLAVKATAGSQPATFGPSAFEDSDTNYTPPDWRLPVTIWYSMDFKAQCGFLGKGAEHAPLAPFQSLSLAVEQLCAGGVGAAHFCPWCDDTKADRIIFFEMKKTSPGDNIFSVAKACGVFPQDIWEVNTAAHRESARSPETAIGLQVHALSLWKHRDSLPLPPSRLIPRHSH